MDDYIIVDIAKSEDHEVTDLINGFSQLTLNHSSDSPTKPETIIHSLSRSTFEVIQNDEQEANDHSTNSIQDQKETFIQPCEEKQETFFENNNQESPEIVMIGAYGRGSVSPVLDLEMAKLQQNDIQEDHVDEHQMEDLRNEKGKLYEGNSPRRYPRENFIDKNQYIEERSRIPNQGLRNLGNTCYINALLQCLYHVERFRECIIQVREHEGLPLLGKLANFFIAMKNDNYWEIVEAHKDLLRKIREIRCEIMKNQQGDSTILFRAIIEELSFQQEDFRHLPQLEMFAGNELTKIKTCASCKGVKRTSQLIKILEARDVNFVKNNQTNYFQSPEETQYCPESRGNEKHLCSYMTSGLPEILVIRIQDTVKCEERVEILPELFLKQIDSQNETGAKKVIHYEFLAGVLNIEKGENGLHSVEISRHGDLYYEFNDHLVKKIRLEDVQYHPKLLFYKRC